MSALVTVVGEALVDVIISAEGARERIGGSPLNVAVTLGRLGSTVQLRTALGDDMRGARIRDHLHASLVRLDTGSISLPATSTATAELTGLGDANYRFAIDWALPPTASVAEGWLHVGSLGSWLEPGADTVETLVQGASGCAVLSFDPNIRPSLIAQSDAQVRDRVARLLPFMDVVKLSSEDALWLYGTEDADVLQRILAAGPAVAILTMGSAGSVIRTANELITIPAAATTVVDTIGAGDAYMGALIHMLNGARTSPADLRLHALTVQELTAAGTFAAWAAGKTIAREGADPPWAIETIPA